ncbi:MAG: hypothetical protein ACRECO_14655 [Xanthobacteraceae bacterium]
MEARRGPRRLGRQCPARFLRGRAPPDRPAQRRPRRPEQRPRPRAVAGAAIADDSPEGARARQSLADIIVPAQTRKVITDGLALGYRYDPSPIIWPDGTPASPDTVTDYHPTARPGSRAPHAWLAEGRSIIDAFGRGFVLLRMGESAADSSSIESALRQRRVPLSVLEVRNPAIAALYERALVLVRPDGHVAWRADAPPADALALADRVRGA